MTPPQRHRPWSAAGEALAGYRTFAARAAHSPARIGSVAPSSPRLAREMAAVVPSSRYGNDGCPTVVELGPGTGALSAAVARRLPRGGRHLAIELDPGMVGYLRQAHPRLEVIKGDAANLGSLLRDAGVRTVDAVVSGLPWSIFSGKLQQDILLEIGEVLAPGAAFATFAYVHAMGMSGAQGFRRRIGLAFDEVMTTRTVWRNLPPARVYVCRRPT